MLRVRYAIPGVVMTPALTAATREASSPAASVELIQALDSRVSWPMTTRASRFFLREPLPQSSTDGEDGFPIQWILARHPTNSIRTK